MHVKQMWYKTSAHRLHPPQGSTLTEHSGGNFPLPLGHGEIGALDTMGFISLGHKLH